MYFSSSNSWFQNLKAIFYAGSCNGILIWDKFRPGKVHSNVKMLSLVVTSVGVHSSVELVGTLPCLVLRDTGLY